jgi:hypothetical protein
MRARRKYAVLRARFGRIKRAALHDKRIAGRNFQGPQPSKKESCSRIYFVGS